MKIKLSLVVALLFIVVLSSFGQVTTSSMTGHVTFAEGNDDVIGATVQAVHEPSGTRYNAVTNVSGRFSIQGMRTGGPYTVTVSYIGYDSKTEKGVVLQLAETYQLDVKLSEDVTLLNEVVVSGRASKFSAEKTGAATNITSSQIVNMPTVTRSITDLARLSPYGGNDMGFAGSDGRTANFTVDGANFNNNFGLSNKLPGGGTPISIDAIEEIQVVISPFDVRQTNFIGGGMNAITKSGTNTYRGSAYVYHQNENMQGDAVDREQFSGARAKNQTTIYGFTLGGPILKDRLFFFANGEISTKPTVVNRWRGATLDDPQNAENYVSRTTQADLAAVSDYVARTYGYDTGSYTSFPADEKNYKLLARLDWNITNRHHLALRYNYTKNRTWKTPNAVSMDGGPRMTDARISQMGMSYANSMYAEDNLVHSFSVDLNSRLTDNLSNQFLATYSKLDDLRDSKSGRFPFIDIIKDNNNYISLGYELFTWNNAVHNTIWNVKDDVTYYMATHKITAGVSFEHQMSDNMYMRNGLGYYRFKITDDMYVGGNLNPAAIFASTPEIVALTYGYNGEDEPASRVRFNRLGFYLQDDWNVADNLKVTAGLRLDGLSFDNADLMTNLAIYNYAYNGRHIDTGKWPEAKYLFSPRLGFTWDVFGNKQLKVRGGTGLFSGRLPLVFFTNMPNNSNMLQYRGIWNATGKNSGMKADMTQFDGQLLSGNALRDYVTTHQPNGQPYTDPNTQTPLGPATITPEQGVAGSYINAVDPNFKMPQVWKTSIAVDYQLPVVFPFTVTVEAIFNKTVNGVCISDWSMKGIENFERLNGVDNRPLFSDFKNTDSDTGAALPNAFILTNTSKGYGWTFNTTLTAQPYGWLNLMAAYTHTMNKEITGMPGNDASSAFAYIPSCLGANNVPLHNSQYVIPDRFLASATIHDKSGNHYSFIYEGLRGRYNTTLMTANDMNGDGYNYDVVYLPTDEEVANNQFRFATDDDRTRFMDFVHANDYLRDHQGSYAEAYSVYSPWVHRLDFAYKHDFKLKVGKNEHKLQLCFDIKNVMNLFNSSWGVAKVANPDFSTTPMTDSSVQYSRILRYEGRDADGYAIFSTPAAINGKTDMWKLYHSLDQCWFASIGVKYYFN
ncbi:MAG: TonB-dependent receptor [Prevotella sp.]|nr:TonB-dependent receptor [Prevotella sp.]